MDSKHIGDKISSILKSNKNNDKVCIFIDGGWGIGKTYSTNILKNEYKDRFIDISVFGKESVDKIQKELMLKIILGSKKPKKNWVSGIVNLGNGIIKNKFGIDFNTYLENTSIESIENKKDIVICIDDIERKSDNIKLVELLGLIERISTKFNVIAIGSSSNILEKEDLEIFNKFREKIIDYEFIVDKIDDNTLEDMIRKENEFLSEENVEAIKNGFKKIGVDNIRIFKKYISLVFMVNKEVERIMGKEKFWLFSSIILECSHVIILNYVEFNEEKKKKRISRVNKGIYKCIEKILRYEDIEDDILYDYFDKEREINKDIYLLRNVHELNYESELMDVLNKIKNKISNYDTNYFIKQKDIINIYDALRCLEIYKIEDYDYYKDLICISDILYKPNVKEIPLKYNYDDWDYVDEIYGMIQNTKVIRIISDINNNNKEKYRRFLREETIETLKEENYDYLNNILKKMDKSIELDYENIFDILFDKLKNNFNSDLWRCIISVCDIIDNEKYLDSKDDNSYICKSRIKYLKECIDYNRYWQYQEEQYRELQKEHENS